MGEVFFRMTADALRIRSGLALVGNAYAHCSSKQGQKQEFENKLWRHAAIYGVRRRAAMTNVQESGRAGPTSAAYSRTSLTYNCTARENMNNPSAAVDPARLLLRHTLATLAYRAGKTLRGAPESFPSFSLGEKGRTPADILAHMGDLFDWALSIARGQQAWHNSKPLPWAQEAERFFKTLQAFDDYLASDAPLGAPVEKLFQGPIADALTHTGQIAILRRMAGCAVKGENYFRADIVAGRVGNEQAPPNVEF